MTGVELPWMSASVVALSLPHLMHAPPKKTRQDRGSLSAAATWRVQVAHLEGDVVTEKITSREELWHNLKFFLEQVRCALSSWCARATS